MTSALVALLALTAPSGSRAEAPRFEKDVLPILSVHCLSCHGGFYQKSELDLRTHASTLHGGKTGAVIRPGSPAESLLWKKIASGEMPKGINKLSASEKQTIQRWLAEGAPGGRAEVRLDLPAKPRPPAAVAADIDRAIERRLAQANVTLAEPADDAEFLRRAYLDITGRIPPADKVVAFLGSTDAAKRRVLIDELLASSAYGQHFATVWHNLIVPLQESKRQYNEAFLQWLAASFRENRGWDVVVRDIIAAEGSADQKPQVALYVGWPEPNEAAHLIGRLFLGVQLECAECHNAPMTPWRQKEDYWGMVAFFSRVKVDIPAKGKAKPSVSETDSSVPGKDAGPGAVKIPETAFRSVGQEVKARFLNGGEAVLARPPYRPTFAAWATRADNQFFAPAAANRWWAHFFARGLVNPLDDFHDGNLPTHPEVLHLLAHELRVSGFDLKHLVRCICQTQAYQRTSRDPERQGGQERYVRMSIKHLTPEVLYDALAQGLGVPAPKFTIPGAKSTRAPGKEIFVNLFNPTEEPLDPTEYAHGVMQVLLLANNQALNDQDAPRVGQLIKAKLAPAQAVEQLYLTVLARRPTETERDKLIAYLTKQSDSKRGYADVLWLLLNSSEFVCNR